MATIIQFPCRAELDDRRLSAALDSLDLEQIMRLAVQCPAAAVRERASRWLLEVMRVRVVA
jgi:hypothetical protein